MEWDFSSALKVTHACTYTIAFQSQLRTSLWHAVTIFIALHALRMPTAGWGLVFVAAWQHQAAKFSMMRQCVCWCAHVLLSLPEPQNIASALAVKPRFPGVVRSSVSPCKPRSVETLNDASMLGFLDFCRSDCESAALWPNNANMHTVLNQMQATTRPPHARKRGRVRSELSASDQKDEKIRTVLLSPHICHARQETLQRPFIRQYKPISSPIWLPAL